MAKIEDLVALIPDQRLRKGVSEEVKSEVVSVYRKVAP